MDIHEIRKTMQACSDKLEELGYLKLSNRLNIAEKQIEEEIGLRWTQASELAEALERIAAHEEAYDRQHAFSGSEAIEALAKWKEANK